MMLREMAILISSATAIYVWLCAVAAPLLSAIRSVGRAPLDARSWGGAALALSTSVLWTIVATGFMLLVATLAPQTALAFVESPVRDAALVAAAVVWIVRSVCMGVPRLGHDVEIASALAVVALFRDDLKTLRSAEALYRERVLAASSAPERSADVRVATV